MNGVMCTVEHCPDAPVELIAPGKPSRNETKAVYRCTECGQRLLLRLEMEYA